MKKLIVALVLAYLCSQWMVVRAEYVLPYPSFMPGNKLYVVTKVIDKLKQYVYFGDIAQIKYHTQLADKYLVEAKTLFEYKQYLLGYKALESSSSQWVDIERNIQTAKMHKKDTTRIEKEYKEEAMKHIEVLEQMRVPNRFLWIPEKGQQTDLLLQQEIEKAIALRKKAL